MLLNFDAAHVKKLLEMSLSSTARQPVADQIYDQAYWRDDLTQDRKAILLAEIKEDDIAFSTQVEDIDRAKIPTGLILVGDQGVYLMSQASNEDMKAAGLDHVCYADEVNPKTIEFDTWWDAKRASFGGDDGTIFIPAEAIEHFTPQPPSL